ncbi:hypothetical protein RHGRI_013383 [Rhododendron griersonianum]|uniref:F-box associated beta-propeller type 1 domain-containing protein n=1 Tax=Rhododendron griersonianum TaxID=479676 RepID=A0AAV6K5D3_9ERIC|nr:hypothetical protein RHGRI_013383 [Rhododendron griersonianum]
MDDDEFNHYSLVNPSTREFRKLSPSPFAFDPSGCVDDYGLGYDSQSDDYKVVSISRSFRSNDNVVSVYALRTNTWKKIESSPYNHWNLGHKSGVFVSGALHWFAGTSTSTVIVALDLADEKFRTVPSLGCVGDNKLSAVDTELTVLGGCLCVSTKWGNRKHLGDEGCR